MVATTVSTGEGWSSRTAFILAAVGAAVGLGNIWRFPTLAGESGGGAFVIFYIACVFLLGLPLVLSEIFIGRVGQTDAVGSIRRVAAQFAGKPGWSVFGADRRAGRHSSSWRSIRWLPAGCCITSA